VLNTEGERYKEGRKGVKIRKKMGSRGGWKVRRERDKSRGSVRHEVVQGDGDGSGERCNISKPSNTCEALKEGICNAYVSLEGDVDQIWRQCYTRIKERTQWNTRRR
jgi:hypothetical protein